jgi:drug/metabolite transporter (DMT)-like permease
MVIIAFALVYVIWGSTYLAIHYAIATIPPFLMAGTRFLVAGVVLYAWQRTRGGPKPTPVQWRNAAVAGTLLLLVGNGLLAWAEVRVPSGLAALIVAIVPLWMVLFDWLAGGPRPGRFAALGIAMGFFGVALLVNPAGHGGVDPIGALALLVATIGWSVGTLFGRRVDMPKAVILTTAMEMIAGGTANLVAGGVTGEFGQLHVAAISRASLFGLIYLIILGSWVAYSAYTYLVTATTPARLGTYAYVNPVIAIILGWLIAGEPIGPRTIAAMGVIVAAVVLLTLAPPRKPMPAYVTDSSGKFASSTE